MWANNSKTVLDTVVELAPGRGIFSFTKVEITSDAPSAESWDYAYVVIPVNSSNNAWMVLAYRMYKPTAFWMRIASSVYGWTTPEWSVFNAS